MITEHRNSALARLDEGVVAPASNTQRALDRKARAQARASAKAAGAEDDLHAAHARTLNNRAVIEAGGLCGCYHCLATFAASDVVEWVGASKATALCPSCHIDAVVSSRTDPIDPGFLRRMHDFWFE